ncbi:hypothetical protein YC2023_061652 [Brassica napus]
MESGFVTVGSGFFVRELKHATGDGPKYIEVYSWFEGMWLGYGCMRNRSALWPVYALSSDGALGALVIDVAVGKFEFWLVEWIVGFDFEKLFRRNEQNGGHQNVDRRRWGLVYQRLLEYYTTRVEVAF